MLRLTSSTSAARAETPASGCHAFLLKRAASSVALEAVPLADNETKVFHIVPGGEDITLVLSVGPGRSGDFVQLAERRTLLAQCRRGVLRIAVRKPDGTERELAAMKMADLARNDVRVNVTGKAFKRIFRILQGDRVETNVSGPVIDMFGGKLPLGEHDYALTIETHERADAGSIQGEAPLEFSGYLFTRVKIGAGREGNFAVDLAASSTVVARTLLPPATTLREMEAVEFSEKGKRMVESLPGGAGGDIEGVMVADLAGLSIGTATIPSVTVDVLETLPALGGRHIDGILGLDLLQRAQVLSFGYPASGSASGGLKFSGVGSIGKEESVELPFVMVADHIMIQGRLGTTLLDWIVDTGAPDSIVPTAVARAAGLSAEGQPARPISGLDGSPLEARTGSVARLTLGNAEYAGVAITIADLPLFSNEGLKNAGLLGNSFFKRFSRIEVDFEHHVMRWK